MTNRVKLYSTSTDGNFMIAIIGIAPADRLKALGKEMLFSLPDAPRGMETIRQELVAKAHEMLFANKAEILSALKVILACYVLSGHEAMREVPDIIRSVISTEEYASF